MPDEPETETETEVEPQAEPAREADLLRDPLLESLQQELGEALLGSDIARDDIVVRVDRSAWRRAAELLKTKHGFDYFCFLSGIDWMPSTDLATRHEKIWDEETDAVAEVAEAQPPWETGRAGGSTRFQVFARLYSIERKFGITLKADLDDTDPSVDSWAPLFRGADWHEREAWEMFGFDFVGHPGLRHLYLPSEFEGNPMRKDFPLLAREVKPWPGLVDKEPIPGEDEESAEEPAEANT